MRIWRPPLLGGAGGGLNLGVHFEPFETTPFLPRSSIVLIFWRYFETFPSILHSLPLKHLNSILTMERDSILMGIAESLLIRILSNLVV
jgi:hypothetical protein